MAVDVADHEPAAVVVDEQRVRARLIGHVVAGAQRALRAVDLEVAHGAELERRAAVEAGLYVHDLARLRHRQLVEAIQALALEHRQAELDLRIETQPVDRHGRLAGQAQLRARRQRGQRSGGAELETLPHAP